MGRPHFCRDIRAFDKDTHQLRAVFGIRQIEGWDDLGEYLEMLAVFRHIRCHDAPDDSLANCRETLVVEGAQNIA
jgi:hypothetical protein